MPFITQPTEEGEKKKWPNCGPDLISRLKESKDFPSKIQWQDKEQTKAHFDKTGNCKGQEQTTEPSPPPRTEGDPQEQLHPVTKLRRPKPRNPRTARPR